MKCFNISFTGTYQAVRHPHHEDVTNTHKEVGDFFEYMQDSEVQRKIAELPNRTVVKAENDQCQTDIASITFYPASLKEMARYEQLSGGEYGDIICFTKEELIDNSYKTKINKFLDKIKALYKRNDP